MCVYIGSYVRIASLCVALELVRRELNSATISTEVFFFIIIIRYFIIIFFLLRNRLRHDRESRRRATDGKTRPRVTTLWQRCWRQPSNIRARKGNDLVHGRPCPAVVIV